MIKSLRRRFLAGVLILAPVVVTAWILWKVFSSVDSVLSPLQERYPILDWPGVGFVAVLLLVLMTGFFAGNFLGSRVIQTGERLLYKVPLIRRIYSAVKELSQVFFTDQKTVFKEVVLIPYPHPNSYALAFVTQKDNLSVDEITGRATVSVFVPTTPNPTSGFLLFIPREEVISVPIPVEEGLKMVISGGAFIPSGVPAPRSNG